MKLSTIALTAALALTSAGGAMAETYVGNSSSYTRKNVYGRVNFSGNEYVNGVKRYESGAVQFDGDYKFNGNGKKGDVEFVGSYSLENGRERYRSASRFNGYEGYTGYGTETTNETYAGVR